MPGDEWQKRASLRLLLCYQHAQPGKKLLFMGGELGQWQEWGHDRSLDWHLLEDERHAGIQRLVGHLNRLHQGEPALHELDHDPAGFEWIDANDFEESVLTFLRKGRKAEEQVLVAFNMTPVPRYDYCVGVPHGGRWNEILNSDAPIYGGSGQGNLGGLDAHDIGCHGRPHSVNLTLPPLGMVMFKR